MLRCPVIPRVKGDLIKLTNAAGGEAVPWTWYDTAPYVSTATTELVFFNTGRANLQATNLGGRGQLQSDQFFQIYYWGCNIRVPAVVDDLTALTDMQALIQGGTAGPPTWTFELSSKVYGPFPLTFLPAAGGVTGFLTGAVATGAAYANNGIPGSATECWDGAVVIPPQQGFTLSINWDAAQTLAVDGPLIQPWMRGTLYRRVN